MIVIVDMKIMTYIHDVYIIIDMQSEAIIKERSKGMKKKSSVAVEEETRLKLDSMGSRHESYDQIIRRLIKFYEENYREPTAKKK